jgi:hypothetical protein
MRILVQHLETCALHVCNMLTTAGFALATALSTTLAAALAAALAATLAGAAVFAATHSNSGHVQGETISCLHPVSAVDNLGIDADRAVLDEALSL